MTLVIDGFVAQNHGMPFSYLFFHYESMSFNCISIIHRPLRHIQWICRFWCLLYSSFALFLLTISKIGSQVLDATTICDKVKCTSRFLTLIAFITMLVLHYFEPLVFVIWIVISIMFIDFVCNWILKVTLKLYKISKDATSYIHNILKSIIETNNEGATIMRE